MKLLVSVDPGVQGCGVAVFQDETLFRASYVQATSEPPAFALDVDECSFVMEKPQVYRTRLLKGDPNDLVDVAVAGALLIGHMMSYLHCKAPDGIRFATVYPAWWKKQLPKKVCEARIRRELTETELTHVERAGALTLTHNIWDAVGIGLWALGRFKA